MRKNLRRIGIVLLILGACLVAAEYFYLSRPCSSSSPERAKEAVLRQDLFTLRWLIQQYTLDKQEAPLSLNNLVQAGYLKRIPNDPMTGKVDWIADELEVLDRVDQQRSGIADVHSASSARACDGSTYSSW